MGVVNHHIALLQEQVRKLLNQPVGEELIHDLRVVIKKIRALWVIHPIGSTIPFKTSFPALRKLFKVAAKTRDLQMTLNCLQTLPDFEKYPELTQMLKKEIRQEQKKLQAFISRPPIREQVARDLHHFKAYYKITSGFLLKKNKKHYRQDVSEHLSVINPKDAEKMHSLRKLLKNYMYQQAAFHSENSHNKLLPPIKNLETIQKDLGQWHDWWNTCQWIENIALQKAMPGIEELKKQVLNKEAALKREMIRNIKNTLKAADLQ